MASTKPTREACLGLGETIHEEAHLGLSYFIQSILKTLRLVAPTICWSSMFPLLTTLLEKKILPTVPSAPHFT